MQITSTLKCPWCFYKFDNDYSNLKEINKTVSTVCPKCTNSFTYTRDINNKFHTSNKCEINGVRHNWKYQHVQGYDLYKKCRRCGKEDFRQSQIKLPGFTEAAT